MPTQPGNHCREDSLPSLDPLQTFTGSVVGSISRRNRRSFAALAQKTSNALASFSTTTTLRSSNSYGSLSRKHSTPLTPPIDETFLQLTETSRPCSPALVDTLPANPQKRRLTLQRLPTPPHDSRSEDPPKMHQTSSRLLRMTEDERPFTKVGSHREI